MLCVYIHVADYVVFAIVTFGMLRVEVFHIIRQIQTAAAAGTANLKELHPTLSITTTEQDYF